MTTPLRSVVLAALCAAAAASALAPVAGAAPPTGFSAPVTLAPDVQVSGPVVTADAPSGGTTAVAFADTRGGVWAGRVRADGTVGSPLPAASRQRSVRDLQVAMTDQGELVVVWSTVVSSSGRAAVRYAVAAPGRSFSGVRLVGSTGSDSGATPRLAALRGGTTAVIFRDLPPGGRSGVLRYARRAPHGTFGAPRSLGHDGVSPEIAAAPGGGALLAWARGPIGRRALEVAAAQRGATLPGRASSVAGAVRAIQLAAGADGTAWVAWTRRDGAITGFARRTRAANVGAVGPVRALGPVAYGVPHQTIGAAGTVLTAWNAQGPGTQPNVRLASALGSATATGTPVPFDAGGFSQTSPLPALLHGAPLVLFTRQVDTPTFHPEVAVANAATGEATVLGPAQTISTPGVARAGEGVVVAWAAPGGGVAVSVAR